MLDKVTARCSNIWRHRAMWHRALRQKTLDIKKEVPPLSHLQPCAFVLLPWCTRAYMATWAKPARSGSCSSSRVLLERRLPFHKKTKNQNTHLSFHVNVELLDTLQGKLFFLHQDANRIPHKLLGHLQHFSWHGGREQNHLRKSSQWINTIYIYLNLMWHCTSRWMSMNIKKEVQHLNFSALHNHLLPANNLLASMYETDDLDHTFITDFC